MNLNEIIEQLRLCDFKDDLGHLLENNVAFQELVDILNKTKDMSFGEAIIRLKAGDRVCRAGWNGKGMWLVLIDENTKATLKERNVHQSPPRHLQSYIAMRTVQETYVPWLASQTDMLSDDWQVVE